MCVCVRGFEEGVMAACWEHHPGGHKQSQWEESQEIEEVVYFVCLFVFQVKFN